jgi:hypothetical protein
VRRARLKHLREALERPELQEVSIPRHDHVGASRESCIDEFVVVGVDLNPAGPAGERHEDRAAASSSEFWNLPVSLSRSSSKIGSASTSS